MFDAEINRALTAAVDLLNTAEGQYSAQPSPDGLTSIEALKKFIAAQDNALKWPSAGIDRAEVERVRELRSTLGSIWTSAPIESEEPIGQLNSLLEKVGTKIVRAEPGSASEEGSQYRAAPIPVSQKPADVMTADIAAALQFLVVHDETGRMRTCRGQNCDAAIVDLTRNRSKLFCDFGNCANRAHVRAYRARQAALRDAGKRALAEDAQKNGISTSSAGSLSPATGSPKRTKPSSAEKAAELKEPKSATAVAAKEFRDQMRDELMATRDKKDKKKKKGKKKSKK